MEDPLTVLQVCSKPDCDRLRPIELPAGECLKHRRESSDPGLHELIRHQLRNGKVIISNGTVSDLDLDFISSIASRSSYPREDRTIALHYIDFKIDSQLLEFRWPTGMEAFQSQSIYAGRMLYAAQFYADCLGQSAIFDRCHFGLVEFHSIESRSSIRLENCSFGGNASLYSCQPGSLDIASCDFKAHLTLTKTVINGGSRGFRENHVARNFEMHSSELSADTAITFLDCEELMVSRCTFRDRSTMTHVTSRTNGYIQSCIFDADVSLDYIDSKDLLSVPGLTAGDRAYLDLASTEGQVAIADCTFGRMPEIRGAANPIYIDRCDFTQGGSIFLATTSGNISQVRSEGPLEIGRQLDETGETIGPKPIIRSIIGADMRHVELFNLDLSSTTLRGVRNLDSARIKSGVVFATPIYTLATRRRMLANEIEWRLQRYAPPPSYSIVRREHVDRALLGEIEQYYRALRKGLEDSGDQPGAADFYYGEMEMRRCRSVGWEKLLLEAYWMVSGYGLRAWRSIAALTIVLILGALLLWGFGFGPSQTTSFEVVSGPTGQLLVPRAINGPRPNLTESMIFTLRTATSFARPGSPPPLTPLGNLIELAVRILAPIFVALSALAIRARLRR